LRQIFETELSSFKKNEVVKIRPSESISSGNNMEAQLIRKSKRQGFVEHLHFVIAVSDKEISLVTMPLDTLYSGEQELGGFGFALCECSPDEAQAVFRCYLDHARLLEIYFRVCQQKFEYINPDVFDAILDICSISQDKITKVTPDSLSDLLNWGFLSEQEIAKVTHFLQMMTDNQYRMDVEEHQSQQKREKKDFKKHESQNRPTYLYLMRDNRTNDVKIGHGKIPVYREKTLQSEKPDIDLIVAWRGTAPEEKKLHEEFSNKRKRGEWFTLTEDDVENIKVRFAGREHWKIG
jgi:hypothetical protein